MEPAIIASQLTKYFGRSAAIPSQSGGKSSPQLIKAVDHVDLVVKEGELMGLLGPNGAGKTTTVRLLSTLLIPDEGDALIRGYSVVKEPAKVRPIVGVVTGGERGLYGRLTGRENLLFFARMYGVPDNISKPRIQALLELVQLENRADDRVEHYSRGMKQRLHIIRGLVHDPQILLLDEPTLGLDPASARTMREFVKNKLQGELKKTIILTTHYMEEADQLCDRISIINRGRILAQGTPHELKQKIYVMESFEIKVSSFESAMLAELERLPFVRQVEITKDSPTDEKMTIKLELIKGEDAIPAIIDLLRAGGVKIYSVQQMIPSLEDAFISITGKELRD